MARARLLARKLHQFRIDSDRPQTVIDAIARYDGLRCLNVEFGIGRRQRLVEARQAADRIVVTGTAPKRRSYQKAAADCRHANRRIMDQSPVVRSGNGGTKVSEA